MNGDSERVAPCCAASRRIEAPDPAPLDDHGDVVGAAREDDRRRRKLLEAITDAHVHLWPDGIYRALWRWFDDNAWKIRFRATADETARALAASGVRRAVSLVYAHKPGIARTLNAFAREMARAHPWLVALGTVSPDDHDAIEVVREALGPMGLRGIKLHCHVQKTPIDDPRVVAILRECAAAGAPAVVHCGRAPASDAYGVDTHEICDHARCERVLQAIPSLTLVVPHLGLDEIGPYLSLVDRYEGLYLDTSMACAEYFEQRIDWSEIERRSDRIAYGTDFPIIPFEYDRELRVIARRITTDAAFERIVRGTSAKLWPE
ncbi:MAG: amidohydrolase [Myxococcales bacterium]|nr:amidohydrolase [Myxococcales bacterium]